ARPKVIVVESLQQKVAIETLVREEGKRTEKLPIIVCLAQDADAIGRESIENPRCSATPESQAYICFTSGSTGRPKGVRIPHRGVVRLVKKTNYISISPVDVFLQHSPVGFDASTFEIWGCLLNGARLVLADSQPMSLAQLG